MLSQSNPSLSSKISEEWNTSLQVDASDFTLGGLLTTLAEAEVFCRLTNHAKYRLLIAASLANALGTNWLDDIVHNTAMGRWGMLTERSFLEYGSDAPGPSKMAPHDTSLLTWLFVKTGIAPILTWNPHLKGVLEPILGRDPHSAIVVHLRNTSGDTETTSAANGSVWAEALEAISDECDFPIVLIGDEPKPESFQPSESMPIVDLSGSPLSLQLYAAASAGAYLGMASGLASAALFSRTPTIIFKSSDHHTNQMNYEFGHEERVAFWRSRQFMIRHQPTAEEIVSEWRSIAGPN